MNLGVIRDPGAHVPPEHLLDRSPIPVVPAALPDLALEVEGLRVAVDLDDTLLHNSHTCPELWDLGGYQDRRIGHGYHYDRMRRDVMGRLRRLRGRAAYDTIDRGRHPFMGTPRVVVAPNLALLTVLEALRVRGARLALATASARARVDYLLDRLPVLRALFGDAILCAEDLGARAAQAARVPLAPLHDPEDLPWPDSAAVHATRPCSLVTKTPWALASAFGGEGYDFLIDDSPILAELFSSHGLAHRLIHVPANAVSPDRAIKVAASCLGRMAGGERSRSAPAQPAAIARMLEHALPRGAVLRFEDPLYWPYMHLRDQFGDIDG